MAVREYAIIEGLRGIAREGLRDFTSDEGSASIRRDPHDEIPLRV